MNRVAMITGSSRGMGKAEAYEFASRGYDVIVHYVNSKEAALISLTKTSSLQFAPYVNVNCVCPGWVATDMNKDLPQELLDYQASKTCKGRMAKPEEVAKLVAFLASDDAEFIDGEVIKIDGGYRLM